MTDEELAGLSATLLAETGHLSSSTAYMRHHCAKKMVADPASLDWIMRQLRDGEFHWQWIFIARQQMDYDPLRPESRGVVEMTRQDYVSWYFSGEED